MMKKKKILVAKPNWPSEYIHYADFFKHLDKALKDHAVTYQKTRFNLKGTKDFVYAIGSSNYDLYLVHHPKRNDKNSIDFKPAYYNNLWYFDNNGYSGFSDLIKLEARDHDPQLVQDHYEQRVVPMFSRTKYDVENSQTIEAKIPDEFILVATQIEGDSVMSLQSVPTGIMIQRAVFTAKKLGLPVVVKYHPMAKPDRSIDGYISSLRHSGFPICLSKANIRELLDRSVATFVINSGVGFESAIRMIPTFTFGRSDYHQIAPHNLKEEELPSAIEAGVDHYRIKCYLYDWWESILDLDRGDTTKRMKKIIKAKLK